MIMSNNIYLNPLHLGVNILVSYGLTEYQCVTHEGINKAYVSPSLMYHILKDYKSNDYGLMLKLLPYKIKTDINQSANAGKELINERIMHYLNEGYYVE